MSKIPPYSKKLWNECIKLLKNNSTIKNLKITSNECRHCDLKLKDPYTPNQLLLDELMGAFIYNNSIKSLYLEFGGICKDSVNHLISKTVFLLDHNTTLESLHIGTKSNNCYNSEPTFEIP